MSLSWSHINSARNNLIQKLSEYHMVWCQAQPMDTVLLLQGLHQRRHEYQTLRNNQNSRVLQQTICIYSDDGKVSETIDGTYGVRTMCMEIYCHASLTQS
jgi:hypothetical protein